MFFIDLLVLILYTLSPEMAAPKCCDERGLCSTSDATVKALVSGHPRDAKKVSATGAGRLREWFS